MEIYNQYEITTHTEAIIDYAIFCLNDVDAPLTEGQSKAISALEQVKEKNRLLMNYLDSKVKTDLIASLKKQLNECSENPKTY